MLKTLSRLSFHEEACGGMPTYTHCGARVDAVGFAVTLTEIASSSGCSTLNDVIEKSASRPWAVS